MAARCYHSRSSSAPPVSGKLGLLQVTPHIPLTTCLTPCPPDAPQVNQGPHLRSIRGHTSKRPNSHRTTPEQFLLSSHVHAELRNHYLTVFNVNTQSYSPIYYVHQCYFLIITFAYIYIPLLYLCMSLHLIFFVAHLEITLASSPLLF